MTGEGWRDELALPGPLYTCIPGVFTAEAGVVVCWSQYIIITAQEGFTPISPPPRVRAALRANYHLQNSIQPN